VPPVTGYAKSDGLHIAYTVDGSGPDLLYASTFTFSFESLDEEPHAAHYFRRLASFARVIRFDPRGLGLSDPFDPARGFTVDGFRADMEAVLDTCGATSAFVVADAGANLAAIELAATRPERVERLVLYSPFARLTADATYPIGVPQDIVDSFYAQNFDPDESWSLDGDNDLALIAPSMRNDPRFVDWWMRASRRSASPASALAIIGMSRSDVRDRLADVRAPTLVLHRRQTAFIPRRMVRYVAEHIPGATYVQFEGADYVPWTSGGDEVLDEIEEFLTGRRSGGGERFLATVLFTDIVDSTGRAAALGDHAWRTYLDTHDTIVRAELQRYGGREVNTTGDGFLSTFESPTQAVRCAQAIVTALASNGIAVRAGIHTGECERRADDVAGLAVHIAARVAALAAGGEVLVSRTVRDLLTGSGLRFVPRGEHELKGVPETWQLFALEP
jgi:class 3 adenylate cyclase/pimeloyl-ACP methyl ester carboxylesterase